MGQCKFASVCDWCFCELGNDGVMPLVNRLLKKNCHRVSCSYVCVLINAGERYKILEYK